MQAGQHRSCPIQPRVRLDSESLPQKLFLVSAPAERPSTRAAQYPRVTRHAKARLQDDVRPRDRAKTGAAWRIARKHSSFAGLDWKIAILAVLPATLPVWLCAGWKPTRRDRQDAYLPRCFHLPTQNCPKTESRICSTSTTPITSPTARNASLRSTATYSGDNLWPSAAPARSHDSNARRRQSRCRALIATVLSGLRFCLVMRARISFCSSGRPSPVMHETRKAVKLFQSLSSGKSLLFKTTISLELPARSSKCEGLGALRSAMCRRKSASCSDLSVRTIPSRSSSLAEGRRPAVSSKRIGRPSRFAVSSMVSRVVPCISLTITRS